MDESFTQDPQTEAVNSEVASSEESAGQSDGIQKRINELTAKNYETQRQYQAQVEALQRQIAQQNELVASFMANQVRQQPAEEYPQVDPDLKRQMEAILAPQLRQMQQQVGSMQQFIEQREFAAQVASLPPEIVNRAKELTHLWKQRGLQGWSMTDAITHAKGELGYAPPKDTRPRQQADTLSGTTAPPAARQAKAESEPDMTGWDPFKVRDYWRKKVGDKLF